MLPPLPLVGRERELDWLVTRLAAPRGGMVLLAGEAGIGKSRLVSAAVGMSGRPLGLGACPGEGEGPALAPWREALQAYATATGVDPGPLPPPFGRAAAAASDYDLALAVANFLAGGPPALLILEDIHWADPTSLALLRRAAPRLGHSDVVVLATYRTDEVNRRHLLHSTLPDLVRAGAEWLELTRLAADSVALLARRVGRPEVVREVCARSGGNPFFAIQLLTAPPGTLPTTVQGAIDQKLRRLTPVAQEVLTVAAVLGQTFAFSTLQAVSDEPEDRVLAALEEALALHLVHERGERFAFDHALVREVLLSSLIGPRRQRLHRRAGQVVQDPDAAAHHLGRAGDPAAVPLLHAAGNRAMNVGARHQASRHYDRALELAPPAHPLRPELLLLLGAAQPGYPFAEPYYREARAAGVAAGQPAVAALARRGLAWARCFQADSEAVALAEQAHRELWDLAGDPDLTRLRAVLDRGKTPVRGDPGLLSHVYDSAGRYDEAVELARASLAGAQPGDPNLLQELGVLVEHAHREGDIDGFLQFTAQKAEAAETARNYRAAWDTCHGILAELLWHRSTDRAAIDTAAARLEAVCVAGQRWQGEDLLGGISPLVPLWYWRGDWDQVRREADRFLAGPLEEVRWWNQAIPAHAHRWYTALIDCEQGEYARARRLLSEGLPPGGPGSPPRYHEGVPTLHVMRLLARICRHEGNLPAARAWLETVDAWTRGPRPSLPVRAHNLLEWAEWHRGAGDPAAARRAAGEALQLGDQMRSDGTRMVAHRLLGNLDAALELAERAGFSKEVERIQREQARRPLPGGITGREADVVRLVAQGLPDREIAARLHISSRTVDAHLRNIFNKLDVPSRAALAAWALRNGLGESV